VQVLQVEAQGQGVRLSITASVGATTVWRGHPLERPFHEADTALYAAKAAGRGRMVFFDAADAVTPQG
jgi:predicted signal transduction protein with EAL and GGDEF domain